MTLPDLPGGAPGTPPSLADLDRLIRSEKEIPSLPAVIARVHATLDDQTAGARELADVILRDPPLTARLLRLANSAYFRRTEQPVTTVTQSIVILGFDAIRNLALGLTVYRTLVQRWSHGVMRPFWRDSLCAAIVSKYLAEAQGRRLSEEAFVVGLLHDIGKLLLWIYAEPWYRAVERAVLSGTPRLKAETGCLGYTHEDVGELLAQCWGYPPMLVTAVRYHHEDDLWKTNAETAPYHETLIVADMIVAGLFGNSAERKACPFEKVYARVAASTRIPEKLFRAFHDSLNERVQDLAQLMEIPISRATSDVFKAFTPPTSPLPEASGVLVRRTLQLRFIGDLTMRMMENPGREEVLRFALAGVREIFACDAASYGSYSPLNGALKIDATHAGSPPSTPPPLRQWSTVAGALQRMEIAVFSEHPPACRSVARTTLASVPVTTGGGPRGAILLEWDRPSVRIEAEDQTFLRTVAGQLAMALDRLDASEP